MGRKKKKKKRFPEILLLEWHLDTGYSIYFLTAKKAVDCKRPSSINETLYRRSYNCIICRRHFGLWRISITVASSKRRKIFRNESIVNGQKQ